MTERADDSMEFGADECQSLDTAGQREWLETNGLGGYAASSICGMNTRRYHGLLVASVRPPTVRMALLSKLEEALLIAGERVDLSTNEYSGAIHPEGYRTLTRFRFDPYPVWTFQAAGVTLEKSVCMIHGGNTTVIRYRLVSAESRQVGLELRPLIAFRDYHALTHENPALNPQIEAEPGVVIVTPYAGLPSLYLAHDAESVDPTGFWFRDFEYPRERERGLDFREDLFSPLAFTFDLSSRPFATVIASTEQRRVEDAAKMVDAEVQRRESLVAGTPPDPFVRILARAADQFIVARGEGQTIIAGYPWFTDWSRDTMISLPGLTLATGRPEIARSILINFARYADRGMLPNRFPDAGEEPEYNTVDGTLWYFAAIDEYARHTGDYAFVRDQLYDVLASIIDWHENGTRYGIGMDADGLLRAGEPGVQLTWMDARVGDWVVTPRHGKAVEIQALWYNALRVMEDLARRFADSESISRFGGLADRAKQSFNNSFWNAESGCLYDVLGDDGPDASIRPNQAIALSLPHMMIPRERAVMVLAVLERDLLTPVGLRTLAPADPRYIPRYEGGVVSRDGAYHQGTVWPWLIGPYLTGYWRVHGESAAAREYISNWLTAFEPHLRDACLGQVSEIYDGDEPRRPNGCPAQAWSVAELLRVARLIASPVEG